MAESPLLFVASIGTLLAEPLAARLAHNHADLARIISLSILVIGIALMIGSIPDFLISLNLPLLYFTLPFAGLVIRYIIQFVLDRREMGPVHSQVGYLIVFSVGWVLFVVFGYVFGAFSAIEQQYNVRLFK